MISHLPEFLITDKILCHLSTKDAVRTSLLSTKWRNLWKCVPGLDLDSHAFSNFDAFVNFSNRFLDSHKELCICKFKLEIHDSYGTKSHLSSWIDVVTKRKIQQLDVCFDTTDNPNEIPLSVNTCKTLVQLRLSWVALGNVEFVSLPCLKIMHLEWVRYLEEATIEKLISGSPVLEDLTMIRCFNAHGNAIHVCSHLLKRLYINAVQEIVIDAPLLQFLKTVGFSRKNFKIINSCFPAKVDIDVIFRMRDPYNNIIDKSVVCDILTDISKAKDLVIGVNLWKEIFLYSKSEPLLKQFRVLSRLNARYYKSDLELLPILLESCPNLESLILEEMEILSDTKDKEPNVLFTTVPQCLVSSLKFVELKIWISEHEGEMELVRYLLKNSALLKTLRLQNYDTKKANYDILEEILAMPKCSSTCDIVVL